MAAGNGMQRWAGRVALVTGASSGIGRATANALARHNMIVIGCARNTKSIEEDGQKLSADSSVTGALHAIKCDLRQEEDILAMFADIKDKYGGVDVCICNAGIAPSETRSKTVGILNGDSSKWRDMLDVNVMAVAICCREAVKQMEEKGANDGQLIVTNSMSGHRLTSINTHFYATTKHAVTALVEAIRRELRDKKNHMRIAQISPGLVDTEFFTRMYPNDPPANAREVFAKIKPLQQEDIADNVLYILQSPPHVQIHDLLVRPTEQSF